MKAHAIFFAKVLLATVIIAQVPQLNNLTGNGNKFFK